MMSAAPAADVFFFLKPFVDRCCISFFKYRFLLYHILFFPLVELVCDVFSAFFLSMERVRTFLTTLSSILFYCLETKCAMCVWFIHSFLLFFYATRASFLDLIFLWLVMIASFTVLMCCGL